VETLRLRKLQQAQAHIERLLEALVRRGNLVPESAWQIRDPKALPKELKKVASEATKQGRVWSCWALKFHTWLITGDMPLALSRERGTPVLRVDIYDDNGLKDSGLWTPDRDGKWKRCAE
jgi:hypothetical protein